MRAWNDILNPKFIGSWDIPVNGTVIAKITKAEKEEVDNFKTNKKEQKLILYLSNFKPFVCNITNAKAITTAIGTKDLDVWIGKYIEIGTKTIRAFGENTLALRVKDKMPATPKFAFTPQSKHWDATVKAVAENETTIEAIKKKSTLSQAVEEQLKEEAMSYIEQKQNYENESK